MITRQNYYGKFTPEYQINCACIFCQEHFKSEGTVLQQRQREKMLRPYQREINRAQSQIVENQQIVGRNMLTAPYALTEARMVASTAGTVQRIIDVDPYFNASTEFSALIRSYNELFADTKAWGSFMTAKKEPKDLCDIFFELE